ncbi:MAG: hypothetical protein AAGH45_08745, partial [Pseudomonadota bacterium]
DGRTRDRRQNRNSSLWRGPERRGRAARRLNAARIDALPLETGFATQLIAQRTAFGEGLASRREKVRAYRQGAAAGACPRRQLKLV